MTFRKEPFFHANSVSDMPVKISTVLGTNELFEFINEFELELDDDVVTELGYRAPCLWSSFVTAENKGKVNNLVVDLFNRLLRYNPRVCVVCAAGHSLLMAS